MGMMLKFVQSCLSEFQKVPERLCEIQTWRAITKCKHFAGLPINKTKVCWKWKNKWHWWWSPRPDQRAVCFRLFWSMSTARPVLRWKVQIKSEMEVKRLAVVTLDDKWHQVPFDSVLCSAGLKEVRSEFSTTVRWTRSVTTIVHFVRELERTLESFSDRKYAFIDCGVYFNCFSIICIANCSLMSNGKVFPVQCVHACVAKPHLSVN